MATPAAAPTVEAQRLRNALRALPDRTHGSEAECVERVKELREEFEILKTKRTSFTNLVDIVYTIFEQRYSKSTIIAAIRVANIPLTAPATSKKPRKKSKPKKAAPTI